MDIVYIFDRNLIAWCNIRHEELAIVSIPLKEAPLPLPSSLLHLPLPLLLDAAAAASFTRRERDLLTLNKKPEVLSEIAQ